MDYLTKVETWAAAIFHAIRRNPDPSRLEIRDGVAAEFGGKGEKPTADDYMRVENRLRGERAKARGEEAGECLRFDPLAGLGALRKELGDEAIPGIERLQEAIIDFQEAARSAESGPEIHRAWSGVHEASKRLSMFRSDDASDRVAAQSDHLDEVDLRILQAVYSEGATPDNGKRTTYETIAATATGDPYATAESIKKRGRRLVELGFLASKKGAGIWLTEAGLNKCQKGNPL